MKPKRPKPEHVIDAIAEYFDLAVGDFVGGRSRLRPSVHARECAWWMLRHECGMSYPECAMWLRQPCHTTGISAAKRMRYKLEWNAPWAVGGGKPAGCVDVIASIKASLDAMYDGREAA